MYTQHTRLFHKKDIIRKRTMPPFLSSLKRNKHLRDKKTPSNSHLSMQELFG